MKKSDINGSTPDRLYNSYFEVGNTRFKYVAASQATSGKAVMQGNTEGMCQSFSAALQFLFWYLNKAVVQLGLPKYTITQENSLNNSTFVTPPGLTLIGTTGTKGNIYLESNNGSDVQGSGYATVNRYLFKNHWRATINNTVYDPLFKIKNPKNGDLSILNPAANNAEAYSSDKGERTWGHPSAEAPEGFGRGYILIKDEATYETRKKSIEQLYKLAQSVWLVKAVKTKSFKPAGSITQQCKTLLAQIGDVITFKTVADAEFKTSGGQSPNIAKMLTTIEKHAK